MIDNKPEATEQPKPERIISIGEEFQPFDPKHVRQDISRDPKLGGVKQYKSSIVLEIGSILKIPIQIDALPSRHPKGQAITPFDPELGYQIDSDDLEPESKTAKMKRLNEELQQYIDFGKAPLDIDISSQNYVLNKLGLNRKNKSSSYEFSQEMLDIFRRLRVLVSFPESRFEAKPNETSLSLGEIHFVDFHPIDSAPLPAYRMSGAQEGLSLFVPDHPEEVAQISAKFVLAPEEPEQTENQGGERK